MKKKSIYMGKNLAIVLAVCFVVLVIAIIWTPHVRGGGTLFYVLYAAQSVSFVTAMLFLALYLRKRLK